MSFQLTRYYAETPEQPHLPLIISGTITDASGRTLSGLLKTHKTRKSGHNFFFLLLLLWFWPAGQTTEAFYISLAHAKPMCIGLNCALGAQDMRPYLERLSKIAECFVHAYPNAGLPNAMGGYDEKPESMYKDLRDFAVSGFLNMAGGCCGTTPAHIAAIAKACEGVKPRLPQPLFKGMRLSGLQDLTWSDSLGYAAAHPPARHEFAGVLCCCVVAGIFSIQMMKQIIRISTLMLCRPSLPFSGGRRGQRQR